MKTWKSALGNRHNSQTFVNFILLLSLFLIGIWSTAQQSHIAYSLSIHPVDQQAYLKASNTESNDHFGDVIAVDGDTVVVTATDEDSNATGIGGDQNNNSATDSGAVYVFVRSGSTWSQQAYIKASNTGTDDNFGNAVALAACRRSQFLQTKIILM